MKKIVCAVLTVCMLFTAFTVTYAAGGNGTADNPYLISSAADLQALAAEIKESTDGGAGKYWKMTCDIDLSGINWEPAIGYKSSNPFKGNFDGAGHIVRNFQRASLIWDENALFGVVAGNGTVKNLGIENVKLKTQPYFLDYYVASAALVGVLSDNAVVSNCYAKNVEFVFEAGGRFITGGGLVGEINGSGARVENCYALGFERNYTDYYHEVITWGALAGKLTKGAIINCYTDTKLTTGGETGTYISNSYAVNGDAGTIVTAAALRGSAEQLGAAFKTAEFCNNGYPLLVWETLTAENIEGRGTPNEPYLIKTTDNLKLLSGLANSAGRYFRLENDIDMNGEVWSSYIGTEDSPFKGDFDGNGHKIYNYKVNVPHPDNQSGSFGLFGSLGGNGIIHNLGVENVKATLCGMWNWSQVFGAMAGTVTDNAAITNSYAKDVSFDLDWDYKAKWEEIIANNEKNGTSDNPNSQGFFGSAGGIFGELNGSGVEIRECYALNIDNGEREMPEHDGYFNTYGMINRDGGLGGAGDNFASIQNCYSTEPLVRTKNTLDWAVENCYQGKKHTEYDAGYDWRAWMTDVKTLGWALSNDFEPTKRSGLEYPVQKWESNSGAYLNLVAGGSMNVADPDTLFGTQKSSVISSANGRYSQMLRLSNADTFTANVDLTKDAIYRVSFRGASCSGADAGFEWKLGDTDLTEKLDDKKLHEAWDTKVMFVKAVSDGAQSLIIKGGSDIYIDDVEVIKVSQELEKWEVEENLRFAYQKLTTLDCDVYTEKKVCDGLEVHYSGKNGYIGSDGKLTSNIPIGLGTVNEVFRASVDFADETVNRELNIRVKEKEPVDITAIGLETADGKTVYSVENAAKVGTVRFVKNSSDADSVLLAAAYKDGKLLRVKNVPITESGNASVNMSTDGADKIRLFAMSGGTIKPLALSESTYDIQDENADITIRTIGDSLCATYLPGENLFGWGQVLENYFDNARVKVDNSLAQGGMTAEHFINDGRLDKLLAKLKPNDYVMIQLATNDCSAFTKDEFRTLLLQFVLGAREKGAIPVFVTSPDLLNAATDTLGDDGKYVAESKLRGYPDVMRELGEERDVPVIDINNVFLQLMKEVGYSGILNLDYYVADGVHFNEKGANFIAENVAKGVKEIALPVAGFIK